ncbi:MAG: hypothetical protein ACYTFK_01285 [Planctomycetota bacterium]|jgi:hypothetical protein
MGDTYFVDNAVSFRVDSTCSTTGADSIDTIAGGGTIAVGDPLRLNVSGADWEIFRFAADLGGGEWQLDRNHGISVPSAGVGVKYGIYDGKAQEPSGNTGPFPTIARALAAADGGDVINIKKNNGYKLDNSDQIAEALSPTGSGDVELNIKITISGFNTTPGDMDEGQAYYQSAYEAYINGIDSGCIVDIDGDGGAFSIMEIDAKDNIKFKHLYLHNTDALTYNHCVEVQNLSDGLGLERCFFDDAYRAIAGSSSDYAPTDGALISNCYVGPTWNKTGTCVRISGLLNFIVKNTGNQCGLQVEGSGGILGNLMIGGANTLTGNGSVYIENNTVYNCTLAAIFIHNPDANAIVQNNILVPDKDACAINIYSAGGSVRNDYNCIYGADGNPLATPFGNTKSGGEVSVLGSNSIEADPDFVDAAGGDFRPRNPQVLRTGQKDVMGNPSHIGAVLQKYQFAQCARTANMARLGIIR